MIRREFQKVCQLNFSRSASLEVAERSGRAWKGVVVMSSTIIVPF